MQNVLNTFEARECGKISGPLLQLVRVGPQKVWRRQFIALGTSSSGKGLCLYFFTEGTGGGVLSSLLKKNNSAGKEAEEEKAMPLKLKTELELEQGCEARALSSADAPGGKENCFMLVTSKNQIKFQASSEEERTRWVETLAREFEREIELTLIEQKARMLRKGAVLSWHRPQTCGGSISVKVSIDDAGFLSVGEHQPIHLRDVETVLAGNESDELRALGDDVFHFNCFVIKLRQASDVFFSECTSLDFEAPKQSTRDDWVSALEARLKEEGVYFNPNETQPVVRAAAASRGMSVASQPPTRGMSVASQPPARGMSVASQAPTRGMSVASQAPQLASSLSQKGSMHSGGDAPVNPAAALLARYNSAGSGATTSPGALVPRGDSEPLGSPIPVDRLARLKKNNSQSKMDNASGQSSGADANKTRTMTLSVGNADDDDDDETDQAKAATGVGEYFKQKVKLGSDFPYSRCVSFALETALQGEQAGHIVTPERDIAPAEAEEVVHYKQLELPPNQADIQKASQARKKLKRVQFDMTEYAAGAFKELRNRWGISDLDFFRSVSQLSGDGAVGDGKSGMLFFFTRDRRYVLKTVKTNEMAVLVEKGLLKAYIKHMADNPDSLICRFFGLYSFKMGKPAKEITLVCMQNTFDTRLVLHEKYDLKGSTRSRWCTPRFGSVLKDLNFGNQKLYLDSKDRADFLKQCERDTAIFEQFNVMDYSLLLGIHKPAENPDKVRRNLLLLSMANQLEQRNSAAVNKRAPSSSVSGAPKAATSPHPYATRWQRDFGGVEGINQETSAPQVYIMQIIDILQAYDVGKKAENFIKSQMTEEVNEISSVNPKSYRARFLAYMAKITVPVDGQNASLAATRRDLRMKMFNNAAAAENTPIRRPTLKTGMSLPAVEEERTHDVAPVIIMSPQKPPPVPTKRPSTSTPPPVPRRTSAAATASSSPEKQGPTELRTQPPPVPTRSNSVATQLLTGARLRESSFAQALRENDEEVMDLRNEPQLKAEIAAAIAEAEQEKMLASAAGTDVGGAYTEVLEDGTEIVILEDGGFIQRMTTGIVIRKLPDGATRQTNPDGSTIDVSADGLMTCHLPDGTEIVHVTESQTDIVDIQKNPDGSSIETLKDGSTVQKNVDGSRIEIAAKGDKRTIYPDGTIIEQLKSGATRQMNPDGLTIVSLADGTRVQTDARFPHIVLTIYPDGSSVQEDKQDGIVIKTGTDGTEFHEFPDGSKIRIKDGHILQTSADGTIIETFPDGTKTQRNPDGSVMKL